MPELPEVETVRRGLETTIAGATIAHVVLRRKNLRTPFPANLALSLAGQKIIAIRRRAKYLLFDLKSGDTVIAHLGMSGKFSVIGNAPKSFATHDHVVWHLKGGRLVIYNDARRFGLMTLAKTEDVNAHPLIAHLGPEPLEKSFSAAYLAEALSTRKTPVKVALMNQHLVVGVGNIYASEALFLAGINPLKPAHKAASSAKALRASIVKVLGDAIASGGSSLRDFIHVSGESGYFQHRFNVYGRKEKPCFSCGEPIRSIVLSGRSTFYCPHCQK